MATSATSSSTHIEKLVADTEALEPGDVQPGTYIRKPQAETLETPETGGMVVSDLVSAGYTHVYDTLTRESSLMNNNMMAAQLRVTRADGSFVFTKTKPAQGPWRGTYKCFLHPDQPERSAYDAMGFPICMKANMPNQHQANNHGKGKHREPWVSREEARVAVERREDREAQLALIQAMTRNQAVAPTVVKATVPTKSMQKISCGECLEVFEGVTMMVAQNRLKGHVRKVHQAG